MKKSYALISSLLLLLLGTENPSFADEGGSSFWLPGQMGSFSASPSEPGWSFPLLYYYSAVNANASKKFEINGGIKAGLKSNSDFFMITPTYVFTKPVLGGQASIGVTGFAGRYDIDVGSILLIRPTDTRRSKQQSDALEGIGDLYPTASLKWNEGVHNVMVYLMAGVPAGAYNINRLANMGINHWSIDEGAGYTYLDEPNHHEFSAVLGFTQNFENPATHYKNGTDAHLDWSAAHFFSEDFFIGPAGYFFKQITGDGGAGALLGPFKSQIMGVGPQLGYFFKIKEQKWYANIKVMGEFAAQNRPTGWNGWLSLTTA